MTHVAKVGGRVVSPIIGFTSCKNAKITVFYVHVGIS
jgi:hypothetical protein